jgi:hypothetical protein
VAFAIAATATTVTNAFARTTPVAPLPPPPALPPRTAWPTAHWHR